MEWIGIMAALGSAASWAFATVVFDRLGKVIPAAGMTFFKGLFSLVLMIILIFCTGGFDHVGMHDFFFLALSGIVGISIGDTLFFCSLQDLGAKVQVLYFMLGQVVTMFLSFLLLGEILSIREYIGATILLCGIMIVTIGKQVDHPNKMRGIIGGFASILCFSLSSIMVKVSIADVGVPTATFWRMFFSTVSIMFIGFTSKRFVTWYTPLRQTKTLLLFLLNVVVITYGGFLLSMMAIKHITVSLASVLSATEPVFVLMLAYFINQERVSKREMLGAIITISGLLIIILNE